MPLHHTPGPWFHDSQFIIAPDPSGIHPDIYIAEIAETDEEGRVARPEQQEANGRLIAAAPDLLAACEACLLREDIADDELGDILRAVITKATQP